MMVLGIHGSPRKKGNTDILLDHALEGAREAGARVERVYCRELNISGCLACGGCDKTGECVIDDDMSKVYPLLAQAEAIVLAAPIYFYSFPAQAKALIDRAQACWSKRMLTKSKTDRNYDNGRGYLIAVGATGGANLFDGAELTAKYFFDALDMSYEGGLTRRGMDPKGAADQAPDLLREARDLGRSLI
jgi:multimeric flavodoxin WrbA